MAASPLGTGRKGAPARLVEGGETVVLCDLEGPGTVRHIWMTTAYTATVLRGLVLRAWWDGQSTPSIECPLGDFFGFAHGFTPAFQSVAHSVGERNSLNIWLPMPFVQNARLSLTNELEVPVPLFFQVDYTLGDFHATGVGRLHCSFRRENPTTPGRDFIILPQRSGTPGRYLGAVIGVRPLDPRWWGEGEVKIWLDGDSAFPTIVGTGTEDYAGLSFGLQPTAFLHHGANWRERDDPFDTGSVSLYRWHLADPVFWRNEARVTIQQIGVSATGAQSLEEYQSRLFERADDWSAAAFWYQPVPSAPLPPPATLAERLANLPGVPAGPSTS